MRRRAAMKLVGGAAAAMLLPPMPALACRPFPADGEADFLVLRHGQAVGRHRIRFVRGNRDLVVQSDITIRIGALHYRFVHHAEEVWRDGWLHAVVSDSRDDGLRFRLRAVREAGVFGGTVNGRAFTVSGYIIPSSLWHRDTPASEALFDVIDARVMIIRGHFLGEDAVPVRGKAVPAKRYAIFGQIRRELWYDSHCNLVRVALSAPDGSRLTLEPR